MKRIITAIGLSVVLASPLAAQNLRVEGRVNVSSTGGSIVVHGGGGMGARGMWCAAARYADQVLGAADTQRVYVKEGSTLNTGLFTLNPRGLTPSRVSFLSRSVRTPGANLSVAHAQSFCADFRINTGR